MTSQKHITLSVALSALFAFTPTLSVWADEPEGVVGEAYFQELRARSSEAMRRLDRRIDEAFGDHFDEPDETDRSADREASNRAKVRAARAKAEAERLHQARREAERARQSAERARQEALQARREAQETRAQAERARAEREAARREARERELAEQARKAEERARRAGYRARKPIAMPEGGAFERRVLELVNQERARGGECGGQIFEPAPPVRPNARLAAAAQKHSEEMERQRFFDHTDPQGDGPKERIDAQGYQGRAWGENIAAGQRSPESVMRAWMKSPGHCKNVLNPMFNELGVGLVLNAKGPYRTYWTQNFGRSR